MSDSEASAKLHGNKLYHSSRHREYTKMVTGKLNSIKKRFDTGKISQEEAAMNIKVLQRSLRKKIWKCISPRLNYTLKVRLKDEA